MKIKSLLTLPLILSAIITALAQSPNTATMIVIVNDQNGAIIKSATVSIVNNATAASREVVSGTDGTATFPALSLTGTYKVTVSHPGFGNEQREGLTLRS